MVAEPRHYLDHAANSPLREGARQAWLAASAQVGNPAGLHGSARAARNLLEDARELIADQLGAHPTEVVFTSGGSEADTIAVLGGIQARAGERPELLVTATEHPAVLMASTAWPHTRVIPVDGAGLVDLAWLTQALSPAVGVVSCQLVNNEVGTVQPVAELAELAHRHGAWVHTDAVQGILHPGVDFAGLGVDLASVSAHKVGGPVGIGALLARREITPRPTGWGGGQERELRSGTQLVALAAGFAAALAEAGAQRDHELVAVQRASASLRSMIAAIPGSQLNGPDPATGAQSPAIVNATFDSVLADDVLLILDRAGIDASVGSACRAGVHQPSEVILAMGGTTDQALATLRFSLGHSTTDEDLAALGRVLPEAVSQARRVRH